MAPMTTDVQDSIIELLRTYRCLRFDQIDALMAMKYGEKRAFADKQMARLPLLCSHLVYKPLPNHLAMVGSAPDADLLTAMDVALEFRGYGLEDYMPGRPPFNLVFFKSNEKNHLRAYYVAIVREGYEQRIALQAQTAYRGQENAVVFVLNNLAQSSQIRFPYEHYHAIAKNGRYIFYKGEQDHA